MNIQKYFRVCVLLVLACVFAVPGFSAERIRYVIPGFDGSPKLMVDGQGLVRKQYRYAPFGEQILEKSSAPVATQSRRGFVGGQQESDNMVYLQQRYYNPVVGRFYQPDPVSYMAGGETQLNRYHYGLNDPYMYKDEDGRVFVLLAIPEIIAYTSLGSSAALVAQRYMPVIQNYATQAYVTAVRLGPGIANFANGVLNPVASPMEGAAVSVARGVSTYATRNEARQALDGALGVASNRFFRGARNNGQSRDFCIKDLDEGGKRFEYFDPANTAGYGKLYIQEVDRFGAIIREFKETWGPKGLVETKWVHGGSGK